MTILAYTAVPSDQIPLPLSETNQPGDLRYTAEVLRAMLAGTLTDPPDLGRLNGHGKIVSPVYETYKVNGTAGAWQSIGALVQFDPELAPLLMEPSALSPSPKPQRNRICTARAYMDRPPIAYIDDEHLIPEREAIIVSGHPGTGKSVWLLQKLIEIAANHDVFLVAAEGQSVIPDRLRALELAGFGARINRLQIMDEAVNLFEESEVDAFIEEVRSLHPKVIAFDTWAHCTKGADENSALDVTTIYRNIGKLIQALGCSVVVLHHRSRTGTGARGSTAIAGHFHSALILEQSKNVITLRFEKARGSDSSQQWHYGLEQQITRQGDDGEDVTSVIVVPMPATPQKPQQAGKQLTGKERAILDALAGAGALVLRTELEQKLGMTGNSLQAPLNKFLDHDYVTKDQLNSRTSYGITAAGRAALASGS